MNLNMNSPFCYNKECELYHIKDGRVNTRGFIEKDDRRGRRMIYRHKYHDCIKGTSYYFCDICHTAVQMTIDKRGCN